MRKQMIIFTFMLLIIVTGCVPPETSVEEENTSMNAIERNEECDLYLSFAHTNYQNREYVNAIRNFSTVIDLGCASRNSDEIFPWMTRSYIELGNLDSAYISIRQGVKYSPDEVSMLELAAWVAGKMEKTEDQLYYIDKILAIDPENTSVMEKIFDLYKEDNNCPEMLNILKIWLNVEPANKKAIGELRNVYECLGKDPIEIDKERCENDPSNSQLCMAYARALEQKGDYNELQYTLSRILSNESSNTEALKMLAETFNQLDKSADAMKTYEKLFNISHDYKVSIVISEILLEKEDFKNSLKWANTAIKVSNGKGDAFYARGEIYRESVSLCGSDVLSFSDKLAYELAYDDYSTALEKNYFTARGRKESLKDFITSSSDWFMRPETEREAKPEGSCYSWITRTIKRK